VVIKDVLKGKLVVIYHVMGFCYCWICYWDCENVESNPSVVTLISSGESGEGIFSSFFDLVIWHVFLATAFSDPLWVISDQHPMKVFCRLQGIS